MHAIATHPIPAPSQGYQQVAPRNGISKEAYMARIGQYHNVCMDINAAMHTVTAPNQLDHLAAQFSSLFDSATNFILAEAPYFPMDVDVLVANNNLLGTFAGLRHCMKGHLLRIMIQTGAPPMDVMQVALSPVRDL